ncbi:ArsC family reductase [Pseudomonadota bacterium]
MTIIYGIKNCDTMKKAMKWLNDNGVEFEFHDFKKAALEEKQLKAWVKQVGWETLVNKRGLTWRKLPEADRDGIDEAKAIALMMDNLSLIKRPVLDTGNGLHVGFKPAEYEALFS